MRDFLFCVTVFGAIFSGWFLMAGLDAFLTENKLRLERAGAAKEPSRITLPGDLPVEEICGEIKKFRSKHDGIYIVLRDTDAEFFERTDQNNAKDP